jgi:hypothetical protein
MAGIMPTIGQEDNISLMYTDFSMLKNKKKQNF